MAYAMPFARRSISYPAAPGVPIHETVTCPESVVAVRLAGVPNLTVTVAVPDRACPHELVIRTQYCVVTVSGGVVYAANVAPCTLERVSPVGPRNH